MKRVLIISATPNTNFKLANNIASYFDDREFIIDIINLEEIKVPLFTTKNSTIYKDKVFKLIKPLIKSMISSDGIIFCAPEYNGSIPPIVTNIIAWISTSTKYWKDAFIDKNIFVGSSSGGGAHKFHIAIKNQLSHLGAKVYKQTITIQSSSKENILDQKKILSGFIKLL